MKSGARRRSGMLRPALAILLLSMALLAGCATHKAASTDQGATRDDVVVFRGMARLPVDAAAASYAWSMHKTGYDEGEPTIGVASDGTIYTAASGADIGRSDDNGKTFRIVGTPTGAAQTPKASLDPWIWLDPLTDRVYDSPLYVLCTWAAWSDNKGATWDFNPTTGCGEPAHDHQKLTTGPPAPGVTVTGYKDVVYYSYNSFRSVDQCGESCPNAVAQQGGTQITASLDGGRTFAFSQMVHAEDACHAGIASPVMVAPDGTAYSGKPRCDGLSVAVSHDSGKSWDDPTVITSVGAAKALAHMVDVATDANNSAYVTWTGESGAAYLVRSNDHGKTWSDPIRVSPPTLTTTVYNVITAGAAGHVVVGYYGTDADTSSWKSIDAQNAAPGTKWHLYLSITDDAWAAEPTWTTLRLTPADDPVQVGCIWQSGGSNACRNLGDFIDLTQQGGRPYIVYPDGCDHCTSDAQSRGSAVTVGIVQTGPSLLGTPLKALG